MALKKINYYVERKNMVLPEAYAYIIECHAGRKNGYAVFGVFANRQDAENPAIEPHEKKRIDFNVIRTENAFITAYGEAKKARYEKVMNGNGEYEDILVDKRFSDGWKDDIVW